MPNLPSQHLKTNTHSGTPNSSTTTMSELSTVAIKDGHRGHLGHHGRTNHPDAERADRISRLAGLERVARNNSPHANYSSPSPNLAPGMIPGPAATTASFAQGMPANAPGISTTGPGQQHYPAAPSSTQGGYFYIDPASGAQIAAANRERSTVGSASATGSLAGRTTWASMSGTTNDNDTDTDPGISDTVSSVNARDAADPGDAASTGANDPMDTSSMGGFSDEASLVGFGEGARTPARHSAAFTANSLQAGLAGAGPSSTSNASSGAAMGKSASAPGGAGGASAAGAGGTGGIFDAGPSASHNGAAGTGGGSGTNSSTALSGE